MFWPKGLADLSRLEWLCEFAEHGALNLRSTAACPDVYPEPTCRTVLVEGLLLPKRGMLLPPLGGWELL